MYINAMEMLQLKATLLRQRVVIEAVLLYLVIASVTTGLVGYSILILSHKIQYMYDGSNLLIS